MEFGESISSQTICQHTHRSAQLSTLPAHGAGALFPPRNICWGTLPHLSDSGSDSHRAGLDHGWCLLLRAAELRPCQRAEGSWHGCKQGAAVPSREVRGGNQISHHTGDVSPQSTAVLGGEAQGMTAGYKAEGAGTTQNRANCALACTRWVASRERGGVKKSWQILPLQESQNLKCTWIWKFSTMLPILWSLTLPSFAKHFPSGNTLNNCS